MPARTPRLLQVLGKLYFSNSICKEIQNWQHLSLDCLPWLFNLYKLIKVINFKTPLLVMNEHISLVISMNIHNVISEKENLPHVVFKNFGWVS
jgi:hypothetical protein